MNYVMLNIMILIFKNAYDSLKNTNNIKNQRENIDNVLTFKFDDSDNITCDEKNCKQ